MFHFVIMGYCVCGFGQGVQTDFGHIHEVQTGQNREVLSNKTHTFSVAKAFDYNPNTVVTCVGLARGSSLTR